MTEYVYIFTNPAMPDWVKIGRTKNLEQRLKTLSRKTAVPIPFECYAYMEVPAEYSAIAEATLHGFAEEAYDKQKEYFRITPEKALNFLKLLEPNNPKYKVIIYTEEPERKEKAPTRTFELLGIKPGTTLYYKKDRTITCTTKDSKNKVDYNGEETTLSGLAMNHLGYGSINGFSLFSTEPDGPALTELHATITAWKTIS